MAHESPPMPSKQMCSNEIYLNWESTWTVRRLAGSAFSITETILTVISSAAVAISINQFAGLLYSSIEYRDQSFRLIAGPAATTLPIQLFMFWMFCLLSPTKNSNNNQCFVLIERSLVGNTPSIIGNARNFERCLTIPYTTNSNFTTRCS